MARPLVEIVIDDKEIKRLERQLTAFPKAMPRVMSRAINKATVSTRVSAAHKITGKVNITITRAKQAMILVKATFSTWVASIRYQKRRIRIIAFGARQTNKGVTYKINKSDGRELIPGAFITTVRRGQRAENKGVFARRFKKGTTERVGRYPIIQQRGPSFSRVMKENPQITQAVENEAVDNLEKFITAQVDLIFK